ncbi:MAG: hypothetical protein H7Y11_03850, partial [Armatimonadetes bacterium]|nr:hypothetical protein [Anaerolineae bacterium]
MNARALLTRLLLILGGCIVALLLLTLLLLLFPGLILGATSYAERSSANQQITVAFKPSD